MSAPPARLPPEMARSLDRLEGGAITWDPLLLEFLRARCIEDPRGETGFRHRGHPYRCVTQPEQIHELLHPQTDVLTPGLLDPSKAWTPNRLQSMGSRPAEGVCVGDVAVLRKRCEAYLANWRAGSIRSLTKEIRVFASLLLETHGFLPPEEDPDRSWLSGWLDLAHQSAFQPTALTRREKTARARARGHLLARRKGIAPSPTDAPIPPADSSLLWHAGPALELAILSPLWVIVNRALFDGEEFKRPPRDWIRPLIVASWRLLPPFWLRSRETRYEFRLGTERIPAGMRFLFGPGLLDESMSFRNFRSLFSSPLPGRPAIEPEWLFGSGSNACPFGAFALERIGILLEEILTAFRPVLVPGGEGWMDWETDLPEAEVKLLPFHLCPAPVG